jgi:hypothetical protein
MEIPTPYDAALPENRGFQLLSPEIRTTIWHFCCHLTRNVTIEFNLTGQTSMTDLDDTSLGPFPVLGKFYSSSPPPAVLHLCRESRIIGLRYYSLTFGSDTGDLYQSLSMYSAPPHIYFNWAHDRLVVLRPTQLDYISQYKLKYPASYVWAGFLRGFRRHCAVNKLRYLAINAYKLRRIELPYGIFKGSATDIFGILYREMQCEEILFFDLKPEGVLTHDKDREMDDWRFLKGRADVGFVEEEVEEKGNEWVDWVFDMLRPKDDVRPVVKRGRIGIYDGSTGVLDPNPEAFAAVAWDRTAQENVSSEPVETFCCGKEQL